MEWISKWRELLLLFLVILAVIFIHPFNMPGLQITYAEQPASQVIQKGDILLSINGNKISTLQDFQNILSEINPNDTVTVSVLRETFPYTYKQFVHSYIADQFNNKTWLGFAVKETLPTNIKFSHELSKETRYTVQVNGNVDDAIAILSKRFQVGRISSFSFEKAGNNLIYIYTHSGDEIIPLIESKGIFEAKIGDKLFFNNSDITKICTSGVDCAVLLYQYANITKETSELVWKFGFDVFIANQTSQRFADLTKGLSISKCEGDRCFLNESIDYYLDGKLIGSEEIYADFKGRSFSTPNIGGTRPTKQDAEHSLFTTQALLQGIVDAKVIKVESVQPTLGDNFLTMFFAILVLLILGLTAVVFVQTKGPLITTTAGALAFAELLFVLGWLAVLNILVTPITLFGLVTMVILTFAYKIYIINRIKKEGLSRYIVDQQNSKINKVLIVSLIISLAATFVIWQFTAPLVIYFTLLLFLTKKIFIKNIKAKA